MRTGRTGRAGRVRRQGSRRPPRCGVGGEGEWSYRAGCARTWVALQDIHPHGVAVLEAVGRAQRDVRDDLDDAPRIALSRCRRGPEPGGVAIQGRESAREEENVALTPVLSPVKAHQVLRVSRMAPVEGAWHPEIQRSGEYRHDELSRIGGVEPPEPYARVVRTTFNDTGQALDKSSVARRARRARYDARVQAWVFPPMPAFTFTFSVPSLSRFSSPS